MIEAMCDEICCAEDDEDEELMREMTDKVSPLVFLI